MFYFWSISAFLCVIYGLFVVAHRSRKNRKTKRVQLKYVNAYIDKLIAANSLYPVGGIDGSCRQLAHDLNVGEIIAHKLMNVEMNKRNIPLVQPKQEIPA